MTDRPPLHVPPGGSDPWTPDLLAGELDPTKLAAAVPRDLDSEHYGAGRCPTTPEFSSPLPLGLHVPPGGNDPTTPAVELDPTTLAARIPRWH